jgi:hypothetical protein
VFIQVRGILEPVLEEKMLKDNRNRFRRSNLYSIGFLREDRSLLFFFLKIDQARAVKEIVLRYGNCLFLAGRQ